LVFICIQVNSHINVEKLHLVFVTMFSVWRTTFLKCCILPFINTNNHFTT